MEKSAFEALMVGVNVFVFIIALTAGLMLMTSVLDMVEYANEISITGMNGSLAETLGEVHERIYTGEQMLGYYGRNNDKYKFYVKLSEVGNETALSRYIENTAIYSYLDESFELQYKGIIENKDAYVFVLKKD